MSEILLVSKPIAPPWNDGSKTLVRDLAMAMTRHDPVVLGVRGVPLAIPRGRVEPLFYQPGEGFGLRGMPAMRLVARLASGPAAGVWHFVFAPNPRTSSTARALARLRRAPTVQTVASVPDPRADLARVLFGDRVVVLSRRTERRFLQGGVDPARLARIAPCVAPVVLSEEAVAAGRRACALPASTPLVVFPGDLDRDRGAPLVIEALAAMTNREALLVVAARRKSFRTVEAERELRARAMRLGVADRIRWVGETPHIHALLAAADVVALPALDLSAKVDLPVVLLEAVSLGTPVVVARGSSAEELADDGGGIAVEANASALAESLDQITSDTSARAAHSAKARAGYERYRPARMAAAYETLYDQVLR